jgi:leucyl-tRNA synthetase
LYNQGMILAYAYETKSGSKVASDEVEERDGKFFSKNTGEELNQIIAKMSKTLKNVVNPDDVVRNYGADSLRLYEMFMGPLEATKPWTESGVKGVFGFLSRVHKFFSDRKNITEETEDKDTLKILHQTIKKVQGDIEGLRFNTAIAKMMEFINHCIRKGKISKDSAEKFIKCLSPFAPHLAEELWELYGHETTLAYEPFPLYDKQYLVEDTYEYPVSFNGKMRFKLELPLGMPDNEIESAVLGHDSARKWIEGKQVKKVIIVKGKIVNIVVT